ncbi:hypothetical protein Bca52824_022796 [Brassica carinata]|uniref:Ubiquitin-like protease family profile domain-containing protein n=1 Tax=Brassica carinata TaxID=52824 RepID=A0A8X7VHD1_BRACI|nr:hypothetical protein Bca52824_022796 [Brassica carinata]
MPGPKKLRLALIIIVDGVLIAHQQMPRPTLKYVRMVQKVDSFCNYPWGRESFLKTITCMKPPKFVPKRCEDPIATLVQALKQDSFRLSGFPLPLQLLAYQCVPTLQSIIPVPDDSLSIMDLLVPHLPLYPAPSMNDILRVEADPELEVSSLIPIHSQPQPGWKVWPDVCNDDRVSYMEQRIADNYPFEKHHWHGGDTSVPIVYEETSEEENSQKLKAPHKPAPNKTIMSKPVPREAPKKSLKQQKKTGTTRKQRRISNYFHAATSSSNSNDKILELLSGILDKVSYIAEESKLLRKMLKRKKSSSSLKRSAFNILLDRSKKGHQTLSPIEEDHSPVISQYEAQLHGSTSGETTELAAQAPPVQASLVHIAHPTSPELHHLLFHGKEIIEKISPDSPSLTQPKYDSSTNQASRRQIFPLSPLPFTPETSPNKSSDSLPGFVRHASSINAFSATATSTPLSVSNPIAPHLQDHPMEDSDIVELSDSSPARERARHMPTLEEDHLAKELRNCKSVPAPDLSFTHIPDMFHITPSKFDFSNDLLLKLAKPTQWTTTYHMEVLMHMLAERHSSLLEEQKLAFVSPHLTSGLQAVSRFQQIKKEGPCKKWMEDVFTVYTPMIWDDQHWVGLAINLDLGYVEILDPLPDLYKDRDVDRFMAPVLKTLPFLVKKVANYQLTQFRGLEPFSWHRVSRLYINERGGDYGLVSVKFLELHAHGDPENHMSRFTNKTVDDIRRQYALDIYKTIVMPAYYAPAKA